jgi:hypothetical protein
MIHNSIQWLCVLKVDTPVILLLFKIWVHILLFKIILLLQFSTRGLEQKIWVVYVLLLAVRLLENK